MQPPSSHAMMSCERLHVRLTVLNCAKRWQRAQDGEQKPESLASCLVCEVGERNAGGCNGAA